MRFFGKVGFIRTVETTPGVWTESVTERNYYGDVVKNVRKWSNGEGVNDNIDIQNSISIVADSFAIENLAMMKYVEWMGTDWKISSMDIEYPRIILSIGGVYNGQ